MKKEEQLQKLYNQLLDYQKQLDATTRETMTNMKSYPNMTNALDTFNIKLTMVGVHSMLILLEYTLDDSKKLDRIQNIGEELKQLFLSE